MPSLRVRPCPPNAGTSLSRMPLYRSSKRRGTHLPPRLDATKSPRLRDPRARPDRIEGEGSTLERLPPLLCIGLRRRLAGCRSVLSAAGQPHHDVARLVLCAVVFTAVGVDQPLGHQGQLRQNRGMPLDNVFLTVG